MSQRSSLQRPLCRSRAPSDMGPISSTLHPSPHPYLLSSSDERPFRPQRHNNDQVCTHPRHGVHHVLLAAVRHPRDDLTLRLVRNQDVHVGDECFRRGWRRIEHRHDGLESARNSNRTVLPSVLQDRSDRVQRYFLLQNEHPAGFRDRNRIELRLNALSPLPAPW